MKTLIKFPSIEQFRSVIHNVSHHAKYVGQNEQGEPIYDHSIPLPTITFKGSVKLHGSNGALCYNDVSGLWCQSKDNILEVGVTDNYGFALFVEQRRVVITEMLKAMAAMKDIDLSKNSIAVYGEWCGGSIQKSVALNKLEKMFVIFGIKIRPFDDEQTSYWIDHSVGWCLPAINIYNISKFEN